MCRFITATWASGATIKTRHRAFPQINKYSKQLKTLQHQLRTSTRSRAKGNIWSWVRDLPTGKARFLNVLKHFTTNLSTFQVPLYLVSFFQVLRYHKHHLLSFQALPVSGNLDDLRITPPDSGLQDTLRDMCRQFLLQFCQERKRQSSREIFSHLLIHRDTWFQGGTKRYHVLIRCAQCQRARKSRTYSVHEPEITRNIWPFDICQASSFWSNDQSSLWACMNVDLQNCAGLETETSCLDHPSCFAIWSPIASTLPHFFKCSQTLPPGNHWKNGIHTAETLKPISFLFAWLFLFSRRFFNRNIITSSYYTFEGNLRAIKSFYLVCTNISCFRVHFVGSFWQAIKFIAS